MTKKLNRVFILTVLFFFMCSTAYGESNFGTNVYINDKADYSIVVFTDLNLEKAIRELVGKQEGDITKDDIKNIKSLNLENMDITSLNGLEYFLNLERLNIRNNFIQDLTPLTDLGKLSYVDFQFNNVSDVLPLTNNKLRLLTYSGYGNPQNNTTDIIPKLDKIFKLYLQKEYDKAIEYSKLVQAIDKDNPELNKLIEMIQIQVANNSDTTVNTENSIAKQVSLYDNNQSFNVEILPRIELLSGVLTQTSWMNNHGPADKGNNYYQDLEMFFSKYKDHEAIKLAEEFTQNNFAYDGPPRFILSLSELPYLEFESVYEGNLIHRAKGIIKLERFRKALLDLARESKFEDFFNNHREEYSIIIESALKDVMVNDLKIWMDNFFKISNDECRIVLAPAMFKPGLYGITTHKLNDSVINYAVIREDGYSNAEPKFLVDYKARRMIITYEYVKSFVYPALQDYHDNFNEYEIDKLYNPISEKIKETNPSYANTYRFIDEQISRSITAIAIGDLYSEDEMEHYIQQSEAQCFYLTRFTIDQINKNYKNNRTKFKTFQDFIPFLLEKYNENQNELLKFA